VAASVAVGCGRGGGYREAVGGRGWGGRCRRRGGAAAGHGWAAGADRRHGQAGGPPEVQGGAIQLGRYEPSPSDAPSAGPGWGPRV
jgi:hypothetical protein